MHGGDSNVVLAFNLFFGFSYDLLFLFEMLELVQLLRVEVYRFLSKYGSLLILDPFEGHVHHALNFLVLLVLNTFF